MKLALLPILALMLIGFAAWMLCFSGRDTANGSPSLLNQWEEQIYSLDADEDVRFVPPPFSPQRGFFVPPIALQGTSQFMCRIIAGRIGFTASTSGSGEISSGSGTVHSAFTLCTYLSRLPDLELPDHLGGLPAHGDWLVRDEGPMDRRMKTLGSILSGVTGRDLAVERRFVERDVIIARGKWNFDEYRDLDGVHFYFSKRSSSGGGGIGTLADSFASLEKELGRKIFDETDEPRPREVYWTGHLSFFHSDVMASYDDSSRIKIALASLERQTSLKFVQSRRVIPVWIVSEKGKRQ